MPAYFSVEFQYVKKDIGKISEIYNDLLGNTKPYDTVFQTDKMKMLEKLAIDMWRYGGICSIQAGWEGSECTVSMEEIIKGIEPIVEPFAIVPRCLYREEWGLEKRDIEGNGTFIYNKEHWYYSTVSESI